MTLQFDNTENNKNVSDLDKKMKLLGVQELTDVEKKYSLNALRIFKERYLLKDNAGNTVERLDQLFKRVAMGVGIMEVLYDPQWYSKEPHDEWSNKDIEFYEDRLKTQQEFYKDFDYKNINNVQDNDCYDWDDGFYLNPYHYERLLARYIELLKEGKILIDFAKLQTYLQYPELYPEFKKKYFSLIKKYYDLMANKYFLPNTPALMNVGTKLGMNAACFCLKMDDTIDDIGKTNADIMKIFKSGGGIGINYSSLRPEGAYVSSTGGVSSGALSFLNIVDVITGTVAQAGKRRGAAMGILDINHQDIEKFINLKRDNKTLKNHNISVNANNFFFWDLFLSDKPRKIMDKITENAWLSGDPGMVFEDNMNSNNLLKPVLDNKPINVTNPCSEIPQYPFESCILASINLTKFVDESKGEFEYVEFGQISQIVTQFLDSMIDATKYPIEEINDMTKKCRRIGVGFMGLADTLVKLGIKYNSEEGFNFIERISRSMTWSALDASCQLARQKGAFPLWYDERYPKNKLPVNQFMDVDVGALPYAKYGLRNCSVTTIAPTGTLSMFCDISSGIEPIFSRSFTKNVTLGEFEYGNEEDSDVMITAMEMHPFDHIMAQAVAQHWITNGISKCVAKGTLIQTNKGVMKIEDLGNARGEDVFGNAKEGLMVRDHNGDWKKVTNHYSGGRKKTIKIKLNNGEELEATTVHKVMTEHGWRTLLELNRGDFIAFRKSDYGERKGGLELPRIDDHMRSHSIKTDSYNSIIIPKFMTPDLAMILGMIVADGSLIESTGHVGIVSNDNNVKQIFIEKMKKVFGNDVKIMNDKRRVNLDSLYLTSRPLVRWMKSLIGSNAFNKHIPKQILEGSIEEQKAFLEGLTLDGYIKKNEHQTQLVIYEGVSKQLRDEVASIIALNGLSFYKGQKLVHYKGKKQDYYAYYIIVDKNWLEPIEKHKNIPLKETIKITSVNIITPSAVNTSANHGRSRQYLQQVSDKKQLITTTLLQKHNIPYDNNLTYSKITNIEESESDVYDIEVEDTHSYLIDGIISHNTINLPNDCSAKMIEYCYVLSCVLGNKGISVYRDGCKQTQVLNNNEKISIKNIMPISEYTIQIIKELNNIPDSYKKEMLNYIYESKHSNEEEWTEEEDSRIIEKYEQRIAVKEGNIKEFVIVPEVVKCPSCNALNTLQKSGRGDSCFLCLSCGSSMGSCS